MHLPTQAQQNADRLQRQAHANRIPITPPNESARANIEHAIEHCSRWIAEAKDTKVTAEAKPHAKAAIEHAQGIADELAATLEKLDATLAELEESTAQVAAARLELSLRFDAWRRGSLDAQEALELRDAREVADARVRYLEHAHQRLTVRHETLCRGIGPWQSFQRKKAEAERCTAAIATQHASAYGCAPSDLRSQGEGIVDVLELGLWALSEPAHVAAHEPRRTRDARTGDVRETATTEELVNAYAARRQVAVETLRKRGAS